MATSKVVRDILAEREARERRRWAPLVIEGTACSAGADPHWDVAPIDGRGGAPVQEALRRLDGRWVRVTVETVPAGDDDAG